MVKDHIYPFGQGLIQSCADWGLARHGRFCHHLPPRFRSGRRNNVLALVRHCRASGVSWKTSDRKADGLPFRLRYGWTSHNPLYVVPVGPTRRVYESAESGYPVWRFPLDDVWALSLRRMWRPTL